MDCLRTPDSHFDNLPDYHFDPHYIDDLPGYEGMRVHYLDERPELERPDGALPVFLCLHGQPTWSYLYRHMIPVFCRSGSRVVAPDWLGFGRSDKPIRDTDYGFHFHRSMMLAFVERLDLRNITLVVQDWGGLIGLTLPQDMSERFSRLIIMNTALATGVKPSDGFLQWRNYVADNPDFEIGKLMQRSCPHLTEKECAAYDAPFPNSQYKAGVRRFPEMVMTEPDMEGVKTSVQATRFWRDEWKGKSFMAVGAQDPVLGMDVMERMRTMIKGCPAAMVLPQAGHFVQEWGEEVAIAALASFND